MYKMIIKHKAFKEELSLWLPQLLHTEPVSPPCAQLCSKANEDESSPLEPESSLSSDCMCKLCRNGPYKERTLWSKIICGIFHKGSCQGSPQTLLNRNGLGGASGKPFANAVEVTFINSLPLEGPLMRRGQLHCRSGTPQTSRKGGSGTDLARLFLCPLFPPQLPGLGAGRRGQKERETLLPVSALPPGLAHSPGRT